MQETALASPTLRKAIGICINGDGFGLHAGTLPGSVFRLGSKAVGAGAQFDYNSKTGTLAFDADGAGGAGATVLAHLTPGTKLGASAFLIV